MSSTKSSQHKVSLSIEQALHKAVTHHQAGQLHEAERLYRAILQYQPDNANANHNLGVLAGQAGEHTASLQHFRNALLADPAEGHYVLSYAQALFSAGQAKTALKVLKTAIQRGFDSPASQALRKTIEDAVLNGTALEMGPSPGEIAQLEALSNAGRHVELENLCRLLIDQYPGSGIAWKLLGISFQAQGKDGLRAMRMASELLPEDNEAHLYLGNALMDLGQFDSAAASYQRALEISPDFAEAHFNFGNALTKLGNLDGAVAAYRRATEIVQDDAEMHNNLGNALHSQGSLGAAATSFAHALEIKPDYAEAHNNLGNAQQDLGDFAAAETSYRRALEIKPDYAEAHYNLGNVLKDQGALDTALTSYATALEIKPDFAEAYFAIGNALKLQGRLRSALENYRHALEIRPNYAEAYNNLGSIQKDLGELETAVASFRHALQIKPDYADGYYNLGTALMNMGKLDVAVESFRQALAINPEFAEAYCNVGIAFQDMGKLDLAIASYRHAINVRPDYTEVHCWLGAALQDIGKLDGAIASYRRALEINPESTEARNCLLFSHNYVPDYPSNLLLAEARKYGEIVGGKARPHNEWFNSPDVGRCIRIGLVSGDFCAHPVGYFIEGMLTELASDAIGRLEIFCYTSSTRTDALTDRIKASCHGWRSAAGLSDEHLADQIRKDGIDILIDLSGHTTHNRLAMFAWKPAPIQATWLGYLGTTGVGAIDYLIADSWTLPADEEIHFSEKIWRLPDTYICLPPPEINVQVSAPPVINNGFITFGCFNNLAKINPAVVALWARILTSVPESRLFLKAKQFKESSAKQEFFERFAAHGIGPQRLIFEDMVPTRADNFLTYQRVDIALDPFPYPGITTTAESLWIGVPVLTLAGKSFLSRQGVGLLMNTGLSDWIASDADDYVAKAVSHATDIQGLTDLRRRLRSTVAAAPIFDVPRFARHFEAALRGMWTQWCDHQSKRGV